MLLASACLPSLFQAVGVKGNDYWDGGYMGNPALSPLLKFAADIVIVEVNPINRHETPHRAADIVDRLNEITFNSSLVHDLEKIHLINKFLEQDKLKATDKEYKRIHVHSIDAEEQMSRYPEYTKSDTSWRFLTELKALGRAAAATWLENPEKMENLGRRSTLDIERFIERLYAYPAGLDRFIAEAKAQPAARAS